MKRATLPFLCLTFSFTTHAADPVALAGEPQLTIRLYDYTEAAPIVLERSRQEAGRVLATAGIETRWEQCRTSEDAANNDASCTLGAGVHVIQLRIHPKEMAKRLTSRGVEFGYSIPLEDGHGIIAGVYLDRTAAMARTIGADLHVVLGHTIAHEIGHLLLGTNSHARHGIMRPTWGNREMHLAKTGALEFTAVQAQRMGAQVRKRLLLAQRSARR